MGDFTNLTEDARRAIRAGEVTIKITYTVVDARFGEEREFETLLKATAYKFCKLVGHDWQKDRDGQQSSEYFTCSNCGEWMVD